MFSEKHTNFLFRSQHVCCKRAQSAETYNKNFTRVTFFCVEHAIHNMLLALRPVNRATQFNCVRVCKCHAFATKCSSPTRAYSSKRDAMGHRGRPGNPSAISRNEDDAKALHNVFTVAHASGGILQMAPPQPTCNNTTCRK